ncbi:hypothetical protein DAPPUDRAFT_66063 [Daphnia pulex]|uniref:G-protein coupled receptors family 1 profile domain-containing protein n=1 Tax=Daphnia pulex TaxID=6669 RepID=E9HUC1_DAPPU|nr:hypothetical protein DAPPUDRAFT_66063 [Daphnia pulex]|eukprot:EFX64650.1 hypothetical protein DAPPUDRAFT_66063 [Daphnia pulex]
MSLVVAVALSVIVLLTIGGNLLILAAVLFNSNLRGPTHILIANLAVADLLLGFLVLPFSATLEVTGNWYFGPIFCDVWAAVDVLCCTASIMSLCVISVDRYIGVTRPLNYYSIVTAKRSTVLCLIVWISSLSISIGPLLGWKERMLLLDSAELQACNVNKEKAYVLFSTIGSFYLPTLIILAIYWRIYRTAVKQTKFLESGTKTDKSTSSLSGSEVLTLRVHVGRANPMKTVATTTVGHHHHHRPTGLSAKMFKFRRQKKAAKTLGIVVGAFLLCWFPFFVILPVEALCSTCNIPSPLFSCCFWLGYCNSCLNPFIYASTSREFKRAFSKILCDCRGGQQQSRSRRRAASTVGG